MAHSYGPKPGVSGAAGENPLVCTQCHAGGAVNSGAGSVRILGNSGAVYIPGVKQRITVQVSDPTQQRWGFQLTARLNSDPAKAQAGDLLPIDNFTQVICEDYNPKPCATGLQFIEHTSAGTRNGTKNGASFQFDWIPPSTNAGPVTLYVAGNAANGNGTSAGDLIYTSSLQLNPVMPAAPVITSVVSAATLTSGPMAANSWVTVYGSNLAATTRSWTTDDVIAGGLPFSLDGVSVLLTGAPRLAYIGYVSPTQVNFLLPSDQGNATVQVQVRNPSGISAQLPITVQANAPQMLTLDGKHVLAAHAGLIFATIRSATPLPTASADPVNTGTTTPARSKFSFATATASGSVSLANSRAAPSRTPTSDKIPDPVPISTSVIPGRTCRSTASRHSRVVSCAPVPNASPALITTRIRPAGVASSRHSGITKIRSPISIGFRCSRANATQSRVSAGRASPPNRSSKPACSAS